MDIPLLLSLDSSVSCETPFLAVLPFDPLRNVISSNGVSSLILSKLLDPQQWNLNIMRGELFDGWPVGNSTCQWTFRTLRTSYILVGRFFTAFLAHCPYWPRWGTNPISAMDLQTKTYIYIYTHGNSPTLQTSITKMEEAYTAETSETLSTSTRCKLLRDELPI
jgi:hypothetical protein